jgi:hypothetical protein
VWEEGRHPGPLVVRAAVLVVLVAAGLSLLLGNHLGTPFDLVFVLVCAGAAMWVAPRDFFVVGVMPPLLLAGTVAVLAWFDRGAVARPDDALAQAFVSGLAHHAKALVIGYAATLALLALRQVALRRRGLLRRPRVRPTDPALVDVDPAGTAPPEVDGPLDRPGNEPDVTEPTPAPSPVVGGHA